MRATPLAAALLLAGAAQAAPADDVQALSWLAGSWIQQDENRSVREVWLAPQDGVMSGLSQTNRPGRKPFTEFMTIRAEPAGVTFTARLDGQSPTLFVLKPGPAGEATFENLAHDFPQRVSYRRCGEDLCARIEGTVNGKPQSQAWRYTRAR
ncbi:hypothetical protein ASE17_10925 [Phenylobacterium sp. Root77]|uniref:DUF6265 family protein n=1 Tax=unclassified Phenylobacterium TaxID=2640670 RepID=UPI0006FB1897|nr:MULTISPECIES: DUF6265 family protein [unclassified Phenylobacterium]KQW73422.1 hypothetical protein ASC73_03495 [Phenylobacterium sp. Root1277]KQW92641.1 hypothetical protein ASC79_14205 [Phenylobacterium sp. Root1290]KRC40868.1 hypothetical protein ASE17_10925 [Phenylobacterium sp. Root77]